MIITVTPNAAIDKTLTVPNFQTGFRHRASDSLTLPGGKGVNVARALKNLGQPVVVTGLVGGRAGQQIVEGLTRENILNDVVHIAGESRTSTVVVDPTTMSQTEVIEYGPVVTPAELEALLDKIEYLAKGASVVVLAGSLPRKVPEDFYATAMQRLRRYRCYLVLDSYGEPLHRGVRARPHLVTPNVREAEDLVGHEFHDEQDIVDATAAICELGARNVIVKTTHGCIARFTRGRRSDVFRATIDGARGARQHGRLGRRVPRRLPRRAHVAARAAGLPARRPRRRRREHAALRRRRARPRAGAALRRDGRSGRARARRRGLSAASRPLCEWPRPLAGRVATRC